MRPSSNNRRRLRGDLAYASSVVKVLAGAGRAISPGRSIKRMLQPRYTAHAFRKRGCGCPTTTNLVKAESAMKASSSADAETTGVRATAWRERTGRVNWGLSEAGAWARGRVGIIHELPGGSHWPNHVRASALLGVAAVFRSLSVLYSAGIGEDGRSLWLNSGHPSSVLSSRSNPPRSDARRPRPPVSSSSTGPNSETALRGPLKPWRRQRPFA